MNGYQPGETDHLQRTVENNVVSNNGLGGGSGINCDGVRIGDPAILIYDALARASALSN